MSILRHTIGCRAFQALSGFHMVSSTLFAEGYLDTLSFRKIVQDIANETARRYYAEYNQWVDIRTWVFGNLIYLKDLEKGFFEPLGREFVREKWLDIIRIFSYLISSPLGEEGKSVDDWMASLILSSKAVNVLAWVWQPFKAGTVATNMPSSSRSISTKNWFLRIYFFLLSKSGSDISTFIYTLFAKRSQVFPFLTVNEQPALACAASPLKFTRREDSRSRLGEALKSEGLLDERTGKIKDMSSLERLTYKFYKSKEYNLPLVYGVYSNAKRYNEISISEPITLPVFIARDLGFVDDRLWNEYLDKISGLKFNRDNENEVAEYRDKYAAQGILAEKDSMRLIEIMFSGNKAAYVLLMRVEMIFAVKMIGYFIRRTYKNDAQENGYKGEDLDESKFCLRAEHELVRLLRFGLPKKKVIKPGIFYQRIKWALQEELRMQRGYRRKGVKEVPLQLLEGVPLDEIIQAKDTEEAMDEPSEIIKQIIELINRYVEIQKPGSQKKIRQVLLEVYRIDGKNKKLTGRKPLSQIGSEFSLGESRVSQIKRKFERWARGERGQKPLSKQYPEGGGSVSVLGHLPVTSSPVMSSAETTPIIQLSQKRHQLSRYPYCSCMENLE